MSSVVISGDTSGAITLSAPAVAGTNTITLPAATGTVQVSGNMPAFSASLSVAQTVTPSTATKVAFNTEQFDTASAYDNATNYRFTPLVAGYYQVNSMVNCISSSADNLAFASLYKNGSIYLASSSGIIYFSSGAVTQFTATVTMLVYMNGSTDYLEIYAYNAGASGTQFNQGSTFSACLVRSA